MRRTVTSGHVNRRGWHVSDSKTRKLALYRKARKLTRSLRIPRDRRQDFADALDDAAAEWEIMRELDTQRTRRQLADRFKSITAQASSLIAELKGLTPEGVDPYDDTVRHIAAAQALHEWAKKGQALYGEDDTRPGPPHSADHALHELCRDMLKLWHDTFGEWPELSADRKTGKPFMPFLDAIVYEITGRGPAGLYDKAKRHLRELRTQNGAN